MNLPIVPGTRSEKTARNATSDVTEMLVVLRLLGAEVEVSENGNLVTISEGSLRSSPGSRAAHVLIPDLIQAVTWLVAGAVSGGQVTIRSSRARDLASALQPELEALRLMGLSPKVTASTLEIRDAGRAWRPVDLVVRSRGIFSYAQPMLALAMTRARGLSTIAETVWSQRFGYAEQLKILGCNIERSSDGLLIHGPTPPSRDGQRVSVGDLRAAATLALAASLVPGATTLTGVEHLDRGFSDFARDMKALGGIFEVVHS